MDFTAKVRTGLVALVAALFLTAPAHAQFINFEDRPPGHGTLIDNGYYGFDWSNFYSIGRDVHPSSGYDNGMLGDRAALNGLGAPAAISRSTVFDFNSAYLGAAWNDGLTVTVLGLRNGITLFSQVLTVNTVGSQFVFFNFKNIDQLMFSSSGGTNAGIAPFPGYIGAGTHFYIDNLSFSDPPTVTPEPVSMVLLGTGLAGVVAARRRRKREVSDA